MHQYQQSNNVIHTNISLTEDIFLQDECFYFWDTEVLNKYEFVM